MPVTPVKAMAPRKKAAPDIPPTTSRLATVSCNRPADALIR